MGNTTSLNKTENQNNDDLVESVTPDSISRIIDFVATHYILTMDFKSLKNLYKQEYCEKLVILTTDILDKYYTDLEIQHLDTRKTDGALSTSRVFFVNKDDLLASSGDQIHDPVMKQNMCTGIAKFYIKIAHLFAVIVTTINPTYTFTDESGKVFRANVYDKDNMNIPFGAKRSIYKLNICENRINSLRHGMSESETEDGNGETVINPNVCSANLTRDGEIKNLTNEPGIPELMMLYYDDIYDYETGRFTGMSPEMELLYRADLERFHQAFTDLETFPNPVKKFSDIKLRDYSKKNGCTGEKELTRPMTGKTSDKLFVQYAENIKKMITDAVENQKNLMNVLNDIFVYSVNPETNKQQVRINPALKESDLQLHVEKTRKMIIEMYIACESDYLKGVKIYSAIVEQKLLDTTQSQIAKLEKMSEELLYK